MKITYLLLENFAGIYVGLGLKKLEIDFKNNKNPMIILNGKNGSGKTVILSALSPFRDSNDERKDIILEGEKGYKEIHFTHKKNKYVIKHFYGPNSNQNKSFISKNDKELNENGGIKTFNNIVKNELKVDQEYFKVGRLGNNVRNFIDLKTAERKKFINQFIPNIDDYLEAFSVISEIYKTENQKLKSLNLKLSKFSDFEEIKYNKSKLEEELENIKTNLDVINKNIQKIEFKINNIKDKFKEKLNSLNDDNVIIEDLIDDLNKEFDFYRNEYKKVTKSLEESNEQINQLFEKFSIENTSFEIINEKINLNDRKILDLTEKNKEIQELIDKNNDSIIEISNNLNKYQYKIDSLSNENLEPLEDRLKELKSNKNSDEKKYKKFINSLSKDRSNFFESILDNDDNLKVKLENNVFNTYNEVLLSNINDEYTLLREKYNDDNELINFINSELIKLNNNLSSLTEKKEKLSKKITLLESKKDDLNVLEYRPSECTINDCHFISNALKYEKEVKKLPKLNKELEDINNSIKECNDDIDKYNQYRDNTELFIKLNNKYKNILNEFNIDCNLMKEYPLHDFVKLNEKLDNYYYYKSLLNNIKEEENEIDNITIRLESSSKTKEVYNLLSDNIKECENSLSKLKDNNKDNENKIIKNNNEIKKCQKRIAIYRTIMNSLKQRDDLENDYNVYKEINEFIDKLSKESEEYENTLNSLLNQRKVIESNYNKTKEEYNNIARDFIIVENTQSEIKEIENNFDDYKIIKESLDPKLGIPLIFIDNYLKDISSRTNELLTTSTKDMFQIRFEITESDFFIQVFKNDGTYLKDINEASQGEESLTNISLSLSMIEKMMDEYNILYLDEIDATLSTKNRRLFLELVEKQIKELNIEQVFIISHNNEFYSSNVDLILLKDNDVDIHDKEFMNNKNIIFNINS